MEQSVNVKGVSLNNAISFANSIGTLIVSDKLYSDIAVSYTHLDVYKRQDQNTHR